MAERIVRTTDVPAHASRREFGAAVATAVIGALGVDPAAANESAQTPPAAVPIRWPANRLLFFDLKELAEFQGLKRVIMQGETDPAKKLRR